MRSIPTLVFLLLTLATPAFASNRVLEINAACASTGCFPGDTAGFPVTITQAGSYRLTSNLDVPAATTAIRIEASNVNVDLGGFEVRSTITCTGYPPTSCGGNSGIPGIYDPTSSHFYVSVRNGIVRGFAGDCIKLAGNSTVIESVTAYYCANSAIWIGAYGRVSNSRISNAGDGGIAMSDGCTVSDNEIRGVGLSGIATADTTHGGIITGNRVFDTGSIGVYASSPGSPSGRLLISKNIFTGNTGAFFAGEVHSLGDNHCFNTQC